MTAWRNPEVDNLWAILQETDFEDLRQQQTGFKFIIHTTISKKGESSFHFSNSFLWNKKTDGSIFVKYENATLKCFVSLYGISSEKNKNYTIQFGSY